MIPPLAPTMGSCGSDLEYVSNTFLSLYHNARGKQCLKRRCLFPQFRGFQSIIIGKITFVLAWSTLTHHGKGMVELIVHLETRNQRKWKGPGSCSPLCNHTPSNPRFFSQPPPPPNRAALGTVQDSHCSCPHSLSP